MNLKLIVTAGPTREWIDPVRFLSNPSTGRTGWEIAKYAQSLGLFSELLFISGPGREAFRQVEGAKNLFVETTEEMAHAVQDSICSRSLLIMTAAPADYRPAVSFAEKRKKKAKEKLSLDFLPTIDILKSLIPVAKELEDFYRVGFAAETNNMEDYARKKLLEKELDFICANRVFKGKSGFGANENTLYVLGRDQSRQIIGPLPKDRIARGLLDYLLKRILPNRAKESA